MNAKEVLEKIKTYLSKDDKKVEVKLESAMIKDSDVMVEAESWEAGQEVFVIADDERVPLPVGEYELDNDAFLVVEEEGIIAEVRAEQSEEQEEEEVVEEEQEMESEEKSNPKKVVESISKEIHFSDDQKNELKELFNSWYAELQKVDAEEVKEEVELSEEVPAAKPIKHSPEAKQEKKQVVLSKNRGLTTVDRILQRQLSRQ